MDSKGVFSIRPERSGHLRRFLPVVLTLLLIGLAAYHHLIPGNKSTSNAEVDQFRAEARTKAAPAELKSTPNATITQSRVGVAQFEELTRLPTMEEPDYGTEDFTHVPEWIPRPVAARAASAEDASLRSDGFVEGTVHFEFGAETTEAVDAITAQLTASGLLPESNGEVFSSINPSRRCRVQVAPAAGGGFFVSLIYQGTDHEKGCRCPTCGGSAKIPEP